MKPRAPGLLSRIESVVWGSPAASLPSWRMRGVRVVQTVLILVRDLVDGQLTLRAMSLVYTTLLSIVPLLALSFSVLKAFGVHNQIQPMLLRFLEPLGEKGVEVAQNITEFIQRMNVGVLGAVGLALLLYTAISLMQKIEESLNFIWHIQRPRRLADRFSRYLSVLLVGPILVFAALGITATVMSIETVRGLLEIDVLGQAMTTISSLTPYLLIIAAFTFVYVFIPNARVRFIPALVGGIAGGVAWQTAGWGFAVFVASSNQYAAIYSSLAILILFMIWLYLSWLILLFGASVAFYVQHPEYLYVSGGEPRLSNRMRERLALSMMSLVVGRFMAGERMPSLVELTRLLGMPTHVLQTVLEALERRQLLVQSTDDPPLYLLARDPSLISVMQVLDTVRFAGEERFLSPDRLPAPPPVDEIIERMRRALESSVSGMSARDLAAPAGPAAAEAARVAFEADRPRSLKRCSALDRRGRRR
ncbi:Ribonuclease BN [Candidatus Accumulibacter aalborgensis]|uniref:Ribonuclease BN n=1 Tax=Candidatus Accumulibacter aalborgensis TaxID=1860102 RepID=A0A1A8XY93_9PROT|nr:YihY/virulence factor BrkB family protein [Candidatus Accumulibacter aalborgensis]SBT09023.1 Ribonuclease BN [Candidatus Accumulibacter aalborgensis]